jgi:hypothetical protein
MLISIALLGFGDVGKKVYEKLKRDEGFGIDFRVHLVQVRDVSKYNPVVINSNGWMVVNDENSSDPIKRVTIGDDLEWLLQSDGHDTVIDCTSYSEESKDLVMALLRRGYWLHTCSKELVAKHWEELVDISQSIPSSRVIFNSIPASKTLELFKGIELTNSNFAWHKDEDLYSYRGAGAEETAEYIVRDVLTELEKRRINKRNKVVFEVDSEQEDFADKNSIDLKDPYYSELFGYKDFPKFLANEGRNPDSVNSYVLNSNGYRSPEFSSGAKVIASGCSFTYGVGVPGETIWANVVGKELGVEPQILAMPGISVSTIVESLFKYFRVYGNPETVLCLFPNLYRLKIPIDGEILASKSYDLIGKENKVFSTVHIENFNSKKYIKKPFDAKQVFSEDIALYFSLKSIRMLEQYCLSAGINLVWSTWSYRFNDYVTYLNKFENYKFDNYFNLLDKSCYSYKKTEPVVKEVILKDRETYLMCEKDHQTVECSCYLTCHEDLLDTYGPEQFNIGLDYLTRGVDAAHPGVHLQAHFAEAFLSEIEKLAPRN